MFLKSEYVEKWCWKIFGKKSLNIVARKTEKKQMICREKYMEKVNEKYTERLIRNIVVVKKSWYNENF